MEGKDILFHKADVIVCDGFVGNTLLKFEGLVDFILSEIKHGMKHLTIIKAGRVIAQASIQAN